MLLDPARQQLQRSFIELAPADVASWAARFDASELPILADTALAIEDLRLNEDAVDAHLLAETLAHDPLMTLKVLAHVAELRRGRDGTDAETLTAALVMLGITPRDYANGHGLRRGSTRCGVPAPQAPASACAPTSAARPR